MEAAAQLRLAGRVSPADVHQGLPELGARAVIPHFGEEAEQGRVLRLDRASKVEQERVSLRLEAGAEQSDDILLPVPDALQHIEDRVQVVRLQGFDAERVRQRIS